MSTAVATAVVPNCSAQPDDKPTSPEVGVVTAVEMRCDVFVLLLSAQRGGGKAVLTQCDFWCQLIHHKKSPAPTSQEVTSPKLATLCSMPTAQMYRQRTLSRNISLPCRSHTVAVATAIARTRLPLAQHTPPPPTQPKHKCICSHFQKMYWIVLPTVPYQETSPCLAGQSQGGGMPSQTADAAPIRPAQIQPHPTHPKVYVFSFSIKYWIVLSAYLI